MTRHASSERCDRPRHGRLRRRRRRAALAALACLLLLTGCGGRQSIFHTDSPQSHNIALLWWWMLGAGAVVFFGSLALLAAAWWKRKSPGLPWLGRREDLTEGMVLIFGIGIPAVVLVILFWVSDVYLVGQTSPPKPSTTAMTIHVIGHQWWWEVRYPGTAAVTANEIHIPVDTRVNVVATTADVIHSFWVPSLNRKIDMIPGRTNRILLYASKPGEFRGQCAQFCGLEHAHMAMYVFAQRAPAFRAWLANMSAPARAPATPEERAGEHVFLTSACESCHTIAGTAAQGLVGPNLTHVSSRTTLAALTIPDDSKELAAWIRDPQAVKPGVKMPDLGLPQAKVADLVAYLDSLK